MSNEQGPQNGKGDRNRNRNRDTVSDTYARLDKSRIRAHDKVVDDLWPEIQNLLNIETDHGRTGMNILDIMSQVKWVDISSKEFKTALIKRLEKEKYHILRDVGATLVTWRNK